MTIREFLGVLRARWTIVAACVLVVLGAAAGFTIMQSPVYEASAKVYLSTTRPPTTGTTAGDANPQEPSTYVITRSDLNTYVEVLGSPDVRDPLRARLGLPPGADINVTATVSELTNVLEFKARSADPVMAARTANETGPILAAAAKKFSPLLANMGQSVAATAIAPASVPDRPVSPDVIRNLVLGVLAGLAIGIGLALVRQVSDTKVRGEDDIKRLSDRPILGNLPIIKGQDRNVLTLEDDPHSHHAESVRRLRTNLLFVDVTTQGHSFVVTSANPGEGKTTTTANLALAMADAGQSVLLIDGDLRNPSVAKTLGFEGGVGLTTILLGQAEPSDVIQRWRNTSLHVLPAGQIPPNPSELLGSDAMSDLFQKLSQDFDFILFDSPPINPVIDAVLIHKLAGSLIMVVAADRTKRRDLETALTSLDTIEVPVSGFVLNLATGSSSSTYRYGTYGYGHTAATHGGRTERHAKKSKSRSLVSR